MLRISPRRWCSYSYAGTNPFKDVTARLNSFEKEVVSLKAFRGAVEKTFPAVAVATDEVTKLRPSTDTTVECAEQPLTPTEFEELYQLFALQPVHPVRVQDITHLHNFDDLMRFSRIARREFAVRLARRAAALNYAPLGLGRMPAIEELRKHYEWSFHDVRSFPAHWELSTARHIDALVRRVYVRHRSVRPLLFSGLQQFMRRENVTKKGLLSDASMYNTYKVLHEMLEGFIDERLRLRFLIAHYMHASAKILGIDRASVDPLSAPKLYGHEAEYFIGSICQRTNLLTVAKNAVKTVCESPLMKDEDEPPEITLSVVGDEELTFVGIPHILGEIVESMICAAVRANYLRQEETAARSTPISVLVVQKPGIADVSLRVSDTAGGISLEETPLSLTYLSSSSEYSDEYLIEIPYAATAAKAFGGSLTVTSIEGLGTDRTLAFPAGKQLLDLRV